MRMLIFKTKLPDIYAFKWVNHENKTDGLASQMAMRRDSG